MGVGGLRGPFFRPSLGLRGHEGPYRPSLLSEGDFGAWGRLLSTGGEKAGARGSGEASLSPVSPRVYLWGRGRVWGDHSGLHCSVRALEGPVGPGGRYPSVGVWEGESGAFFAWTGGGLSMGLAIPPPAPCLLGEGPLGPLAHSQCLAGGWDWYPWC